MARRDEDDARPLADLRQLRPGRNAADVVPRGVVVDDLNALAHRALDLAVRRDHRDGDRLLLCMFESTVAYDRYTCDGPGTDGFQFTATVSLLPTPGAAGQPMV
jgi:hypothetical protein